MKTHTDFEPAGSQFTYLFIYLFGAVLDLHCGAGFSLVVVSRGYSQVAVHGLLTAVASLVGCRRPGFSSCSKWAQ